MTDEEKKILLKDLCARLPYGVNVYCEWSYLDNERGNDNGILVDIDLFKDTILFKRSSEKCTCTRILFNRLDCAVKPYLRPLSSMTEEERMEYQYITERWMYDADYSIADSIDWLNKKHFDYRKIYDEKSGKWKTMIEIGLALEAEEEMYN